MSSVNVERVRHGFESFQRGEGIGQMLDPSIVWHTRQDMPDAGSYHGIEGVRTLTDSWVGAFDDLQTELDNVIDAGDCVVVSLRFRGKVRGSEQTVELLESQVWRLRDGKVVEVHEFATESDALAAAGASTSSLSES